MAIIAHKLQGHIEVIHHLEQLGKKGGAARAVRSGVTQGAKILSRGMKNRAHKGKGGKLRGLLRKSIGQKVKTFRGSGITVAIVGPRKGFLHVMKDGRRVDPVKYAHIEEFGRKEARVKKKKVLSDGTRVYGVKTKQYAGRPFVRPTLDEDGPAAEEAIARGTMSAVEKELRK